MVARCNERESVTVDGVLQNGIRDLHASILKKLFHDVGLRLLRDIKHLHVSCSFFTNHVLLFYPVFVGKVSNKTYIFIVNGHPRETRPQFMFSLKRRLRPRYLHECATHNHLY